MTAEQLLAAAGADGPVTSFRYEAPSLADLFHGAVADLPEPPAGQAQAAAAGGVARV